MSFQTLLYEVRDGIAVVTVNRPDKLNALNDAVIADLDQAVARIEADESATGSTCESEREPTGAASPT